MEEILVVAIVGYELRADRPRASRFPKYDDPFRVSAKLEQPVSIPSPLMTDLMRAHQHTWETYFCTHFIARR